MTTPTLPVLLAMASAGWKYTNGVMQRDTRPRWARIIGAITLTPGVPGTSGIDGGSASSTDSDTPVDGGSASSTDSSTAYDGGSSSSNP